MLNFIPYTSWRFTPFTGACTFAYPILNNYYKVMKVLLFLVPHKSIFGKVKWLVGATNYAYE